MLAIRKNRLGEAMLCTSYADRSGHGIALMKRLCRLSSFSAFLKFFGSEAQAVKAIKMSTKTGEVNG